MLAKLSLAFHYFSLFFIVPSLVFIGFCGSHWFFLDVFIDFLWFSINFMCCSLLLIVFVHWFSLVFLVFFFGFRVLFVGFHLLFNDFFGFFIIHSCFFSFFGVQCFFIIFPGFSSGFISFSCVSPCCSFVFESASYVFLGCHQLCLLLFIGFHYFSLLFC